MRGRTHSGNGPGALRALGETTEPDETVENQRPRNAVGARRLSRRSRRAAEKCSSELTGEQHYSKPEREGESSILK